MPAEPVVHAGVQHAQPVADAAPQVDRRRVGSITGRARELADPRSRPDRLSNDLVIEHEIIGIALDRQPAQQRAAERPQPGMILRQLLAECQVFHERQKPVRHILIPGHPPGDGILRQDPRAQHHVVLAVSDHRRHRRNQQRRVLIIRVHHHDDVRAQPQRLPVAGLLIPPVAPVALMADRIKPELTSDRDRPVTAEVIDEHYLVNDLRIKLRNRTQKRRLRVIGRQDHTYPLGINHPRSIRTTRHRDMA